MVAEDYAGFDVEESRERSRRWMALPGVDRARIGRRSFWERYVSVWVCGSVDEGVRG